MESILRRIRSFAVVIFYKFQANDDDASSAPPIASEWCNRQNLFLSWISQEIKSVANPEIQNVDSTVYAIDCRQVSFFDFDFFLGKRFIFRSLITYIPFLLKLSEILYICLQKIDRSRARPLHNRLQRQNTTNGALAIVHKMECRDYRGFISCSGICSVISQITLHSMGT